MTDARSAALLLATLACANCSLFYPLNGIGGGTGADASVDAIGGNQAVEASPDTNGLDALRADSTGAPADEALDGSDGGGTTDASADGADTNLEGAAPPDAGDANADTEGTSGDGASDVDAAEGAADADGAASPFCVSLSPQPLFCDDFDEHPLPGLWTVFNQVGGTLALDTATSVSPPNSLLARDSALQPGQPLDTALRARFSLPATPTTATPTTIVWDFQIQPAAADPNSGATTVVAALDFIDVSNNRYSVQFAMIEQGASLAIRFEEQSGFVDGGTSYVAHPLPDTMLVGAWTHVGVVISRTAPMAASVVVSFGAVTELNTPLTMTVNGSIVQMMIGASFETEPSLGWQMRYDNVTLNF